jgi:uncharacterized repeat protein (TIGR04076 family)
MERQMRRARGIFPRAEHIGVRPDGFFCDWAWIDIHKLVLAMQLGAKFSPWMKDERTFIACCTDGVKPVSFRPERLEG